MARTFTEAEAQRVFARIAEQQRTAGSLQAGLSLGDLEEAARAAGLDPAFVASAAAELDAPDLLEVPVWGKIPLVTRRSRVVPGVLTDDAWADAVASLRRMFKTQGSTETLGRQRTWTHAVGESMQVLMVRVTAETVEGTTRLTAESGETDDKAVVHGLAGAVAALGLLVSAGGLLPGNGNLVFMVIGATLMALALAVFSGIRWSVARRSRIQTEQFDAALNRIAALLPSESEPAVAGSSVSAARIDAALLKDDLDTDAAPEPRRRDRA